MLHPSPALAALALVALVVLALLLRPPASTAGSGLRLGDETPPWVTTTATSPYFNVPTPTVSFMTGTDEAQTADAARLTPAAYMPIFLGQEPISTLTVVFIDETQVAQTAIAATATADAAQWLTETIPNATDLAQTAIAVETQIAIPTIAPTPTIAPMPTATPPPLRDRCQNRSDLDRCVAASAVTSCRTQEQSLSSLW